MSVNQIIDSMQEVFVRQCRALAHSSGFCRRASRLHAGAWVRGLVFGWLSNPKASVSALAASIAMAGSVVSPQAVQKRFNEAGARLLRGVLEGLTPSALHQAATLDLNHKESAWLKAFPALWLRDSTSITLPASQHEQWPGCGGYMGKGAALKISVQWEWRSGTLAPLQLAPARDHDHKVAREQDALALQNGHSLLPGEMHVFDLGYFDLAWLTHLHQNQALFCCRYKAGTHLKKLESTLESRFQSGTLEGNGPEEGLQKEGLQSWLDALPQWQEQVEWSVQMGRRAKLPVRIIAVRVPPETARQLRQKRTKKEQRKRQQVSADRLELLGWNLYVTNAPASLLKAQQVRVLYRVRWQIERLFRLWKETLQVDEWRTQNPQRILCEIYAKLIGALLTQQLTGFCLWYEPARSLVKCAKAVMAVAPALLIYLSSDSALPATLLALRRACRSAAKIESRAKKPATFQRIAMLK